MILTSSSPVRGSLSLQAPWNWIVAAGCVTIFLGCGGSEMPIAKVSGKVTIGGEPLRDAKLEFTPEGSGRLSVGFTNEQGEYDLQYSLQERGALIGKHSVQIRVYPPPGSPPVSIPEEFQGKTVEVLGGKNEFNFEIP